MVDILGDGRWDLHPTQWSYGGSDLSHWKSLVLSEFMVFNLHEKEKKAPQLLALPFGHHHHWLQNKVHKLGSKSSKDDDSRKRSFKFPTVPHPHPLAWEGEGHLDLLHSFLPLFLGPYWSGDANLQTDAQSSLHGSVVERWPITRRSQFDSW